MFDEKNGRLVLDGHLGPRAPIRRFDVFAEYNRIKNEMKGMSTDQAKGYAIWLAKVVAARKFRRAAEKGTEAPVPLPRDRQEEPGDARYPSLDGKPQTGELFDHQIVDRMGRDFYRQVFSPAVLAAIVHHEPYQDIRDRLRAPWNAKRAA